MLRLILAFSFALCAALSGCSLYVDNDPSPPDAGLVVTPDAWPADAELEPDAESCGYEGEVCCSTGAAPPMCHGDLVCGLPAANVCTAP